MSSNIKVQRICEYCNKEFIARTTVTRYCSEACSKKAYKQRIRNSKIQTSNEETKIKKGKTIEDLKQMEFLTVTQTANLLNCSRQNVYKLINSKTLKATNILLKKTIVKRSDIDEMFKNIDERKNQLDCNFENIDIQDCYTITEIQNKFYISQTALQNLVKKHQIPKFQKGKFVFIPKILIHKIFNI